MRLIELSLKNWRGIDRREIEFSEGVTLVEGPNEIGKSTIIEAIRMLFNELDSSKKQTVSAIKPIDKDVGSTIEVEVTSGEYHFVYSKTFNKTAQTTLNILAPENKQVTGREAHDLVSQMLGETVDMALWEALLVDQGEKVALANIQDSAGLVKALDDAAGATVTGDDDADLYEAARAEYERYFTLKTGKSRFAAEEVAFEKAEMSFKAAQQALVEVEANVLARDRSAAEVLRIKAELPRLKEITDKYVKSWQSIKSLKERVEAKHREFADVQTIQQAALEARENRQELVANISSSQVRVDEARKELVPLKQNAEKCKGDAENAQSVITDLRKQVKTARTELDLALADEQNLQTRETLTKEQKRVSQLKGIAKEKKASLQVVGSIQINDETLERIQEAESRVAIARGTRNTAATTISVSAEKKLVMDFNGEEFSLGESEVETRTIAEPMNIRLPGIASIEVTPPLSVAELQAELEESEQVLSSLMIQFNVKSLKDAVAANEKRADAQRNLDRLKIREEEILDGANLDEIEQDIVSYRAEIERYVKQRKSQRGLPDSLVDAANRVSRSRSESTSLETERENAQEKLDALQKQHWEIDGQLKIVQQNFAGLEAALTEKEERLKELRCSETDADLAERANEATIKVEKLQDDMVSLTAELDESSPDAVEALMNNAQSVSDRAKSELIDEQQNLAVLIDRLQRAQADGRFETREAAERNLEESERTLKSTQRRAKAIELLWNTLNKHRDMARKTYVKPLKEAIERLGKIVFGSSFEIEIGDDWMVLTRTLDGITLPFRYLSIGAKEQLGILTRLAAAQIVATHGGVPLIIDDALGFSDPSRLQTMGAAITAAGKDSQIIILTCTPGRFTHVGSAKLVKIDSKVA